MPYFDYFKLTDDLINHLDPVLGTLKDPFIESRYTGFLAVSSVTVLELSMKSIFCEFSSRKNKVFGEFCRQFFIRINGRIGLKSIEEDYLPKFGTKYQERFKKALGKIESRALTGGVSIKASYGNLVTWRNGFAHEGNIPTNASYGEVKRAYECGKDVMHCLANCMKR
jgi:hypothetical protein